MLYVEGINNNFIVIVVAAYIYGCSIGIEPISVKGIIYICDKKSRLGFA